MTENHAVPAALAEIIDDFAGVPDPEKLELLLEFSDELPVSYTHLTLPTILLV